MKGLAIDIAEHHVIFLKAEKGNRKSWKTAKQFRVAYEDLAERLSAEGRLSEAAEARGGALSHAEIVARSGRLSERASVGAAHAR